MAMPRHCAPALARRSGCGSPLEWQAQSRRRLQTEELTLYESDILLCLQCVEHRGENPKIITPVSAALIRGLAEANVRVTSASMEFHAVSSYVPNCPYCRKNAAHQRRCSRASPGTRGVERGAKPARLLPELRGRTDRPEAHRLKIHHGGSVGRLARLFAVETDYSAKRREPQASLEDRENYQ
jgi:hypothetical protein